MVFRQVIHGVGSNCDIMKGTITKTSYATVSDTKQADLWSPIYLDAIGETNAKSKGKFPDGFPRKAYDDNDTNNVVDKSGVYESTTLMLTPGRPTWIT